MRLFKDIKSWDGIDWFYGSLAFLFVLIMASAALVTMSLTFRYIWDMWHA